MPNFRDLLDDGIFTKMESSIPEISSVSWSSIITGKNPGEHGIYGFTGLIEGTYSLSFPNYRNLKAKPFWQEKSKKKYVIINVPSTYPAEILNGFIVSGFVSLDLEKAVQPRSYLNLLKEIDYKIDVDSKKAHKSISLFLRNLRATHEKRVLLYRKMWEKNDWDTFMFVITGSDRLEHFLMNAYDDPNHQYHSEFLEYFVEIDKTIGEINDKLKDDVLIMLSDHGMETIKQNVHLNSHLQEEGFLSLGGDPKKRYNNIKQESVAFALDPSRIYLNKIQKYPRGSVKPSEEDSHIEDIITSIKSMRFNGEPVIRNIYKKGEIYRGKYLGDAPDLVLLPHSGFNLSGSIGKPTIFDEPDIIKGMHTQPDAFLYVKKSENKDIVPSHPNVEDFTMILKNAR
jgi:predicted AlkP superfamily phosphohydrolase/phosphomutase